MTNNSIIKILSVAFLFTLSIKLANAQENISVNSGGTTQTNYFTELDYEDVAGKLIIKVAVQGKPYRFLLDTGAPNVITKSLFEELNSNSVNRAYVVDAASNADSLAVTNLAEITIGNVVFNNIPTLVANDQFPMECLKVDGSIGSNMLRNSILQISSKTRKIVITDQPEKLNLNSKIYSDLHLDKLQSSPYIETHVGDKASVMIPMLFDTGDSKFFSIALEHYNACEKMEIFEVLAESRGNGIIGAYGPESDTIQYRLQMQKVNINGAIFKNANAQTTIDKNSSIGSKLLNFANVTLDYRNKKFYIEPFQTSSYLNAGLFPVSITMKDRKAVIGIVWDPGLKDKIAVNDELLSIDEDIYTQVSPCDLLLKSKTFEGKDTATVKLRSSSGKIKKIVLNRK